MGLKTILFALVLGFSGSHASADAKRGYPANIKPERLGAEVTRVIETRKSDVVDVVFVGSSTIRGWRTLSNDMKPFSVLRNGIGGATLPDLRHYASELIIRYRPPAVIVYAGDNDIGMYGASAEQVKDAFVDLVETVHGALPTCKIFFVSIKPSPQRQSKWATMQEANRLVAAFADSARNLFFIDVTSAMLSSEGAVQTELYIEDGLHMNHRGYRRWIEPIRSALSAEISPGGRSN